MAEDRNVIKFPGAPFKMTGKPDPSPSSKLVVGPLSFHCTTCSKTCTADFKNMIFKTVEFFCNGCGDSFKVTNPAFGNLTPRPRK